MFALELIKKAFLACRKLGPKLFVCITGFDLKTPVCVCTCVFLSVYSTAYSIQGQSVQIISPSSESHQQVVAVGQPLTAQPQGTVVVRTHLHTRGRSYEEARVTLDN